MFRALRISLFVAGFAATLAHATDAQPAVRKPAQDTDNLYVGVGLFNDMLNANLEAVTGWGNFMLRFGRFKDIDAGAATNISWRKPLEGGSGRESGYYIGVFAGQVMGDTLATKTFQRVGGGGELGYHWVNDYTRAEVMVGIGAARPEEVGNKRLDAVPTMFFNFNMALGY